MEFEGKLAVVTGGGSGMGRELVAQVAEAGCSVAACDVHGDALAQTASQALAGAPAGVRVTTHICDVSDEASVIRFRDEVLAQHETDHVNLVFNNAGIVAAGSFVVDDRATWERVFAVCWGGVYNCSRAFVPLLIASDEGCLVNTSSINAFWAMHGPGMPSTAYGSAKFAVKGFSEALIEDFRTNAPHVKVALVMPGTIVTNIGANSSLILGVRDAGATEDAGRRHMRAYLTGMGVPVEGVDDDVLDHMLATMSAVFTMPAADAARIILDGVRTGEWRILVGDDAHQIDKAIHANPAGAYDPDGPTLVNKALLAGVLTLAGLFDSAAAADLDAEVELHVEGRPIACRVHNGELELSRGAASAPDATLAADPETFRAVVLKEESLGEAERRGALKLTGDRSKVEQLLEGVRAPTGQPA